MTIFTGTFIPYEYEKHDALRHVEERCHGIKNSLRFIEMDNEHLCVRCPLSADYLDIVGTEEEINWLHSELTKRKWYRKT